MGCWGGGVVILLLLQDISIPPFTPPDHLIEAERLIVGSSTKRQRPNQIVTDGDVKNALKAKDVLCVSCAKNVLIPCHDKCLANYKLNVHSKVRRALFTTPRTAKSMCEDTTPVVSKTRFSVTTTQSKSLDTTPVVFKTKIAAVTLLSAKNKVSSAFKTITDILRDETLSKYMKNKILTSRMQQKWYELQLNVGWSHVKTPPDVVNSRPTVKTVVQIILGIVDSGSSKHMTGDRSLLENFVEKFMGIVRFGNDHFEAIAGYSDYVQGNITVCHVFYIEGLGHNLFSVGKFCDGDLEVAFSSKTCYVRNLEGDDLLTGSRESNLYTISISNMAASSPIYDLTKHDLVDGLPKFKYGKNHLCSACERGKSKKSSYPPKVVPIHNHEYSPSTSSIIVEEHKTPPILTTSEEQTSPISLNEAYEFNQEDSVDFDGNTIFVPYDALNFEEAEPSTTALYPSNMHEFVKYNPQHISV
ncbi:hypothetical protein Tco_0798745 [Tanacetum coccineum]